MNTGLDPCGVRAEEADQQVEREGPADNPETISLEQWHARERELLGQPATPELSRAGRQVNAFIERAAIALLNLVLFLAVGVFFFTLLLRP